MDYFTGTTGEEGHSSSQGQKKRRLWVRYAVGCAVVVVVILFIVNRGENKESMQNEARPPASFTSRSQAPSSSAVTPTLPPNTSDDPIRGSENATVTIVEFSDFECPFCRQAYPVIEELVNKYPSVVRFQYRDFPIADVHANAVPAAEAAECAYAQGKFWEYHDLLFANQERLAREDLTQYAIETGLNLADFNACLDGRVKAQEVEDDFNAGVALGVGGTPTWFINGVKYEGVLSLEEFEEIIESLL